MAKVAVRRVNEWDGPAMLKIYAPYTGTCAAPEAALPPLPEYVQRIDRYTYGLGWLLCEIDCQPAGFCHLREDPFDPEDPWSVEFQVYVKEGQHRQGVGKALWTLMRDMLEMGSRRRVVVRVDRENREALGFFSAMGPAWGNPMPSFHPADLLIGLAVGATIRLVVYVRSKNAKKYRHNQEYGSARWSA